MTTVFVVHSRRGKAKAYDLDGLFTQWTPGCRFMPLAENYLTGRGSPRYPLPAVPTKIVYPWESRGYVAMIYVDHLNYGEEDPQLVACWDFYTKDINPELIGKYQRCYTDAEIARWDALGVEWRGK